jgi:hypothetical protein
MTIPGLNIYVDGGPHGDVKMVCNREGMDKLLLLMALVQKDGWTKEFFDSNGEGFELTIEVKDDESFMALEPQWSEEMRHGQADL